MSSGPLQTDCHHRQSVIRTITDRRSSQTVCHQDHYRQTVITDSLSSGPLQTDCHHRQSVIRTITHRLSSQTVCHQDHYRQTVITDRMSSGLLHNDPRLTLARVLPWTVVATCCDKGAYCLWVRRCLYEYNPGFPALSSGRKTVVNQYLSWDPAPAPARPKWAAQ